LRVQRQRDSCKRQHHQQFLSSNLRLLV
jgi:hypothetical protein